MFDLSTHKLKVPSNSKVHCGFITECYRVIGHWRIEDVSFEILSSDSVSIKSRFTLANRWQAAGQGISTEALSVGGHPFHIEAIGNEHNTSPARYYVVNDYKDQSVVVNIDSTDFYGAVVTCRDQLIPGGGRFLCMEVNYGGQPRTWTVTITVTLRQKPGAAEELGQKMTRIIQKQEKLEVMVAENQEKMEKMEAKTEKREAENQKKLEEMQEKMEAKEAENQKKLNEKVELLEAMKQMMENLGKM